MQGKRSVSVTQWGESYQANGAIARLFGASTPELVAEACHALRVYALSFVPFCYIYVLMIVYKLYAQHRMALFISFTLSLMVIPVLWVFSHLRPDLLWYSYLVAYVIEALAIAVLHKATHAHFTLKTTH